MSTPGVENRFPRNAIWNMGVKHHRLLKSTSDTLSRVNIMQREETWRSQEGRYWGLSGESRLSKTGLITHMRISKLVCESD